MLRLDSADAAHRQGPTGKGCSIAEIRVVNDQGEDTPPGEVGEIICRSPANLIGYWNRPEATAEALVEGWLHPRPCEG
jgi:fatty-acyl-CoA synthase